MKRDMDLIRDLLLFAEAECGGSRLPDVYEGDFSGYSNEQIYSNVKLIHDRGLISKVLSTSSSLNIGELTWDGHDFLDSVRDPEIWRQTKEVAKKSGGFTVSLLGDIAKGLIKTQIKKHTGVEIEQ